MTSERAGFPSGDPGESNPMTEPRRGRLWKWLPVLIILGGAAIMFGLAKSRRAPVRAAPRSQGALVDVIEVKTADRRVFLTGTGTVAPRHEVILIPQVTGKIEWVHPDLAAGGRFLEGAELLRIEQADYLLAVERAQVQIAQADYQLEVTRANAAIAEREWALMNAVQERRGAQATSGEPNPLVLHEPQLRQAQAGLTSARAALSAAELSLERTILRAPFNCRVRRQHASPGQLVGPSSQIAVLYATDLVEIEVGLHVADLAWLEMLGTNAEVTLDTGEATYAWSGRVDRRIGVMDEVGRLARVVVQVTDPFELEPGRPELSIGSFVSVAIAGRWVRQTIPIPRRALREKRTVWVVDSNETLGIRAVTLHRLTPTEAFVADGLTDGDRVVLTSLSGAAPGMHLRIAGAGE